MKLFFIFLILLITCISNPDRSHHTLHIKEHIMAEVSNTKPEGIGETVGLGLGLVFGRNILDMVLHKADFNNYMIFSTLSFKENNKDELISIGIFGQVILMIDTKKLRKD